MGKRQDIRTILVIGSGPIVIGQACEFDYAGTQALKALRQEGYRLILANSNPATIMTDPSLADRTYIEPLTEEYLENIIAKERPDALLPILGGQTALNLSLALARSGVLKRYGVEMLGASEQAIHLAEDREAFKSCMQAIGAEVPQSVVVHSLEEGKRALETLGLPLILRPSFTLGGAGGGIIYHADELEPALTWALRQSPTHQCLLEESVLGFKEFELEVVRDLEDRCLIVCSIENLDPMGVHTGDSITVAPQMTLSDREYQAMRDEAFRVIRKIGVACGGANVQFAVDPATGRRVVIEMNPRVSRSSALASKATGYPIAKIAALLSVGYTLEELQNDITLKTKAAFEPALDYVVVKIPRFTFEKFPGADETLGTQMKSVGEVMAMGATFQEALHKAIRSLEVERTGFEAVTTDRAAIEQLLRRPNAKRLFAIGDAFRAGLSVSDIHALTRIDPWFLRNIESLIATEQALQSRSIDELSAADWQSLKRLGFADARIARLLKPHEERAALSASEVTATRQALGVTAHYRRVDTCAGEFAAQTPYLYSVYESLDEAPPTERDKVIILGGGPNRIGQGIEFDYCCVHAALTLREMGIESIMVNCNPETVSTDYDISDRLYFEPVTLEDVLAIYHREQKRGRVLGLLIQYGGQTPLKLVKGLSDAGVPILGTSPDAIDRAEDRARFHALIQTLGLRQPESGMAISSEEAVSIAARIGYPVIMRPSYVLGGRAMEVIYDAPSLRHYMQHSVRVSAQRPILVERFLSQAIEVDVDAISDGHHVAIAGVLEHIEEAGVHSGDAAMALPPFSLSAPLIQEIEQQTTALALALGVKGLMNVQFAVQSGVIYVLEVNPRASRTVPFVAKATDVMLAQWGVRVMLGETVPQLMNKAPGEFSAGANLYQNMRQSAVKLSVFPFAKFPGADVILGPEMRSTGEVMGRGADFHTALLKGLKAAGIKLPHQGLCFLSVKDEDKVGVVTLAQRLIHQGFTLLATHGTAQALQAKGLPVIPINKVHEGAPHIVSLLDLGKIDLVINTTIGKQSLIDSFSIRERALTRSIPYFTVLGTALAAIEALSHDPKTITTAPLQWS